VRRDGGVSGGVVVGGGHGRVGSGKGLRIKLREALGGVWEGQAWEGEAQAQRAAVVGL
jgi:hypothetical protein